ncbi:MOSC domain-containing protein [Streptomyces cavernicola]|uniref:MOSC domain-containing protein n=1 Tax=Streptomyces cavernicola TaxID=3043613 RepID=A0ABT6S614_9ACTN|nr:MOSC domain-containing protein [Streptomyces sp. B-S-A6]MDI3403529.1 MOSC domain-containing protein [Streptomyces sp. B-S-A6]
MTSLGSVVGLSRFPVKSMRGEDRDRLDLDAGGVVGDRLWALRHADGKLGSGKNSRRFRKAPWLIDCAAAYDDTADTVSVQLPDGARVTPGDPRLAELCGPGAELVREEPDAQPPGHQDQAPVSLVGTASLRALGRLLGGDVPADIRRFRKNIVVDTAGDEPWAEEGWIGRELRIGGALLRITERVPRCVMTTLPQPGLPADGRVLKTLADTRDLCFGVYAEVVAPGAIALGDQVTGP